MAAKTGSNSPGDELMTLKTSDVAVVVQQLAQFVEQPRVLDGDDSLRSEVSEQLNLLVGERASLGSVECQCYLSAPCP